MHSLVRVVRRVRRLLRRLLAPTKVHFFLIFMRSLLPRWFDDGSLVSRELTLSLLNSKSGKTKALSLSLFALKEIENERSPVSWIWCKNAWNVFASSFAKVNALFSLSLMLWQLHLVDRERERERERKNRTCRRKKKSSFSSFLAATFSLLFFKNNELLLASVVVVLEQ